MMALNENRQSPKFNLMAGCLHQAEDDDLDCILKEKDGLRCNFNPEYSSRNRISQLIDNFDSHQLLDKNENVLEWWEKMQMQMPELYLSQVVISLPVTQVSVERSFSGLKFVLSPYRYSLDSNILEDLLVVRAIYELFYIQLNLNSNIISDIVWKTVF